MKYASLLVTQWFLELFDVTGLRLASAIIFLNLPITNNR